MAEPLPKHLESQRRHVLSRGEVNSNVGVLQYHTDFEKSWHEIQQCEMNIRQDP